MRPHAKRVVRAITECVWPDPDSDEPLTGVEVGVWRGHTSRALLETFPTLHLTMVDPYAAVGFKSAWTAEMAQAEAKVQTEFASYRRLIMHQFSDQAAYVLQGQQFDFVFLDANHKYDAVQADIAAWWPLVRSGGVLIGHDYGGRLDQNGKFGVKQAVDEFCLRMGHTVRLWKFLVWSVSKP